MRTATAIATPLLLIALLAGCAGSPEPEPTEIAAGGGGGSGITEATEGTAAEAGPSASTLEQAAADGMPGLDITECPRLESYEYTPTGGNTTWFFTWTCATRDAYDATVAAIAAQGYSTDPTVISSEGFLSERTYLQADANGGSTEVQVNLEGWPDELVFEVFVTLTLP